MAEARAPPFYFTDASVYVLHLQASAHYPEPDTREVAAVAAPLDRARVCAIVIFRGPTVLKFAHGQLPDLAVPDVTKPMATHNLTNAYPYGTLSFVASAS